MSVKSVLHKIADEMNRPHFHDEIEAPEDDAAEAPKEDAEDAKES